mmetsp:Transcript_9161/g.19963  ORF Transcript_9161/g.19963 Transcript_9161/m.19963 type:complete len:382 (-) Transcript_9161:120-1265(-)
MPSTCAKICLAVPVILGVLDASCGDLSFAANINTLTDPYKEAWRGGVAMTTWSVTRSYLGLVENHFGERLTGVAVADRFGAPNGTVAIVTGANSGVGLETTRALLSVGVHVVLAVRDVSRGKEALAELRRDPAVGESVGATVLQLDLSDLRSVEEFVGAFKATGLPLNYLINNAGVMALPSYTTSKQGYELQFAINHLAHFHLTTLLLPELEAGAARKGAPVSRVVTVTSCMHRNMANFNPDWVLSTPETYSPMGQYGMSKSCDILFVVGLNKRMAGRSVIGLSANPGIASTALLRSAPASSRLAFGNPVFGLFRQTVPEAAGTLVAGALDPELPAAIASGEVGYMRVAKLSQWATPEATDPEAAEQLWALSEKLVKQASV